jgi:Protein of unknown function (DUF2841)
MQSLSSGFASTFAYRPPLEFVAQGSSSHGSSRLMKPSSNPPEQLRTSISKENRSMDNTWTRIPVQKTTYIKISDEDEVVKFYECRFNDLQQSACKVLGKTFVKLIEPKKQTNHPYSKGDKAAPDWWPPTTGHGRVRHLEPDHLLKPGEICVSFIDLANILERIRLLTHILRMIVEPREHQ